MQLLGDVCGAKQTRSAGRMRVVEEVTVVSVHTAHCCWK